MQYEKVFLMNEKLNYKNILLLVVIILISKVRFFRFSIRNINDRKILKRNLIFKGEHLNSDCIIIGNGPSANNLNAELIKDKLVIAVNQVTKLKFYEHLRIDYYIRADLSAFYYDFDNTLRDIVSVINEKKSKVLLPIEVKELLFQKFDSENIFYYYSNTIFTEISSFDFDFTRNIPGFSNVIHWAIILARYLGIARISIIGIENTNIINSINYRVNKNIEILHAYPEVDLTLLSKLHNQFRMEDFAYSFYKTLKDYRLLNNAAKRAGVTIVNLTENTTVDSLQKQLIDR
jgi:hypothetical protein